MGHNEPGERARAMTNDAPLDHAPDGARTGVFSARVAAVLVSAALFVVYTRTLCPGVLGGDAGELQFVPAILSLPHPTGTPSTCCWGTCGAGCPWEATSPGA